MTEEEYKARLDAFRSSCRIYRFEKQKIELIPAQVSAGEPIQKQLNAYMIEDVEFVERVFERIKNKCGAAAAAQLWMLYVEERTQEDVAFQFGTTRRILQYSVSKWMHTALEAENDIGR